MSSRPYLRLFFCFSQVSRARSFTFTYIEKTEESCLAELQGSAATHRDTIISAVPLCAPRPEQSLKCVEK